MKNATKRADELRSLFRKKMKEHKPAPMQPLEPLKALVRGAMSYDVPDSRAGDAMKAIEKEFVDLNELRVATDLEIQELLGVRYPDIEKRVGLITQSLNAIFEREHTMSLERLKSISKRDARQFLRDLPEMNPFVEAYVMLLAFEGHCVPLDQAMTDFLIHEEILDDGTSIEDAQKFVEHHVKSEESHDYYTVLRHAAADGDGKKKSRSK